MSETNDTLRGELERLFEFEELKEMSTELLGFEPDQLGGDTGKGAFARALVERCAREDALEALTDAIFIAHPSADRRIRNLLDGQAGTALETGHEVGPYRIVKRLGEGGVGVVYLAERGEGDNGQADRVALKVLRSALTRDRSAVRRFLTAQRALRAIRHDGLGRILGVGQLDDGRAWVASEFLDGQPLSARIARTGAMHINEARPIARTVLDAVAELHRRGFHHGDIKTENVFVVRREAGGKTEPAGMLVDGGTDRLLTRGPLDPRTTGALPVFGTAKAMAPEVVRDGGVGPASDVYAAGAMLYELVSGRPPFTGGSAIDVVVQHLTAEPEPPSAHAPRGWVPKDVDQLILKAIAKEPSGRFGSVRELLEVLETVGRTAPATAGRAKVDAATLDKAAKGLEEHPEDEERAVELERLVESAGAWDKAAAAFARAADKAQSLDAKKGLLFRAARIQEAELKEAESAEKTFRRILELDPNEEIARIGIEELKRATGDHEAVVELLLEKVDKVESTHERASVLREIAQLYEEQLEQPDNAFVAWVQALADDPRDERTAREIERLAESPDRWNEAVTTLGEAVQAYEDAGDAARLYTLIGRWYADRLQRPDFALRCFGQALQLDPSYGAAYDGTVAVYRKAQSWQELVQVLLKRADTTRQPAKSRDAKAEAASIVLEKLGDTDRAVEMFREVLEQDPAHPKAADALEAVYEDSGNWRSLVELLENRAHNQRVRAKVETLVRVGEIHEDRLDDVDKAAVYYGGALEHEPRHLGALKGLARVYALTDKYPELLDNLRTQLDVVATPRQKIALLERIAAIYEEQFVDHAKSVEAYEQVVAIEPGNENANRALARLYRRLQRFDDLVDTLDRHAKATEEESHKVELLLQAVRVLSVEVGAPDRAIGFCDRVFAIDPDHAEALETNARLRASMGDASSALEAVEKLAKAEKDPSKRAELWLRAGKILEESGDNDRAIDRYKSALDAEPDNSDAAAALRSIYAARGDAQGAANLLLRELEVTQGAISRAKLYAELGQIYRERLHEPDKAKEAFYKALELDPTCTPAERHVGDLAYEAGEWAEAVAQYEPLLARTDEKPLDVDLAREVALRCGDAFQKLGNFERAQWALFHAKSYAPDDREVLERVAELTFESGDPEDAAELYRDLAQKFNKELVGGERGRILYRQGESLRRAGEEDEALKLLREAALLIPEDGAPLESIRSIYESKGDWDNVVRVLRQRMEHAGDDERFDLLVRVGDVLLDKVGDRQKASKSYVAALEVRPNDRNLLGKLMAVYSETKDWSRLVEVILRIAELVDDSQQLAKYYTTAASIAREELGRVDEAISYYEQALEHDPRLDRAFSGLVSCLTQTQKWEPLADAYRAQIKRVESKAPPERLAQLWDSLGETLQQRLDRRPEAIEALEHAQQYDRENRRRTEQLADYYTGEPERYFPKAVQGHLQLLQRSPYRIESYQALRQLYTDVSKPDEAWCMCQTLRALNMADPEEETYFQKHRATGPAEAQEYFNEDIWFNHIVHPEQDPLLTGIFSVIAPAVVARRAQPLKGYGIDPKAKKDPETDPAAMAQMLHYVAAVTRIPLPDVYYRENDPTGLSILFAQPPAIGLGKAALSGGPPQALAFVAARHLSYFRAGHYLRHLVPTGSGLRAWLLAAIKTVTPQFPVPASLQQQVGQHLEAFAKHIAAPEQDRLHSLVQKLLAAAPELDMKKWVAAVDLTADRIGFALANDLEIATTVIKASPEESSAVPQKERLKELYLYSVSEAYLQLRHKLGIAIG